MKDSIMKASRCVKTGRQRGMTMISVILILCFVGFVMLLVFKILPIYLEYFNIRKAIESVKTDTTISSTTAEVRKGLEQRWIIDYITAIQPKQMKIRKRGGTMTIEVNYEDRRPFIGNMDVVAKFNDTIQLAP